MPWWGVPQRAPFLPDVLDSWFVNSWPNAPYIFKWLKLCILGKCRLGRQIPLAGKLRGWYCFEWPCHRFSMPRKLGCRAPGAKTFALLVDLWKLYVQFIGKHATCFEESKSNTLKVQTAFTIGSVAKNFIASETNRDIISVLNFGTGVKYTNGWDEPTVPWGSGLSSCEDPDIQGSACTV